MKVGRALVVWSAILLGVSAVACGGETAGEDDAGADAAVHADAGADAELGGPASCEGVDQPGRLTIHRLNRVEYDETVATLTGTTTRPADDFPIDDLGRGFDNLATLLSVSPLLVEKHERAVLALVDEALHLEIQRPAESFFEAELLPTESGAQQGQVMNLWTNDAIGAEFVASGAGTYLVEVRALATQAGDALAAMGLRIDDAEAVVPVAATFDAPGRYHAAFHAEAGPHTVSAAFLNDLFVATGHDRNLLIDYIRVEGPFRAELRVTDLEGEDFAPPVSEPLGIPWAGDGSGGATATLTGLVAGRYRVLVQGQGAALLSVDGTPAGALDFAASATDPGVAELHVLLGAGDHTLGFAMTGDRLLLDRVSVIGPLGVAPPIPSASRLSLLTCDPVALGEAACLRETWRRFADRAWRRPTTEEELDRLATLAPMVPDAADAGDFDVDLGFEGRLRLGFRAILLSPHFIFRPEPDPEPTSETARALDGYELATRLSYAVWRTMPDAELFAAAAAGTLQQDASLEAQVRRLLADPRADIIVDQFAGQWLELRNLDGLFRDSVKYPLFNAELGESMRRETELLFKEYADSDGSFLDILDAPATWLDGRLAEFYAIPGPAPEDLAFVRVATEGTQRRGLLSQAAILTVTSHTFRTSPVRRGRWVLAKLLCDEPPPPPPGVDSLPVSGPDGVELDIRALMELHRTDPYCASCHESMDPLGFALEHFDAIGAWRESADGFPVDSSGVLPDGRSFDGALELSALIKADPATARCITTHMFTYLLGRNEIPDDACAIDEITAAWAARGYVFRELVVLIAMSPLFRQRTPAEPPPLAEVSP
ncbi:MAG: DUF1592 domain-containing protein [Myxococcota bacterium]